MLAESFLSSLSPQFSEVFFVSVQRQTLRIYGPSVILQRTGVFPLSICTERSTNSGGMGGLRLLFIRAVWEGTIGWRANRIEISRQISYLYALLWIGPPYNYRQGGGGGERAPPL